MALSERLAYILDFNVQGAVNGLEKVGSTAEKELGKAEAKLDKLGGNLTKFGAGAVAFAGVAGMGLVKLASGAAEAEANTAALRQVVDEVSASTIEDWARGSAEAVGLASKEAISAATGFAGLGKIIGLSGPDLAGFSTQLVQMAADMAAFKDVSPQQALQDLQSLFAGSTEVGRKYNIFLDDATLKSAYFRETGEKVTGTLTAQQRIIATNSELYRQGADMIGQWGRESGELAGQQAQLRANLVNLGDAIGAGVLPMLTDVVGVANKAASAFSSLDPAVQKGIGRFAALGTAGIALVGTLSLVAGQLIKMRDRFSTLNVDTGTRSLNNFGKAAIGVGGALAVASVALTAYTIDQQKNQKAIGHSIDAFNELARVADEQIGTVLKGALAAASLGGQDAEEALQNFARTNIEAARRTLELGDATGLSAEGLEILAEAIAEEERRRAQQTETTEEHADAVEANTEATAANTSAQDAAKTALDRWNDSARKAFQQQQDLTNARRAAADAVFAVRNAEDQLAASIVASAEAQNNAELSDREREKALDDLALSSAHLADETLRLEQETAKAEGRTIGLTEQQRIWNESMLEVAATMDGPQRQAILDYIARVNGVPERRATTIEALIDELSLNQTAAALDDLVNRERIARVQVRLAGGRVTNDGGINFGGGVIARESGGPIPGPKGAPVPAIVHGGEHVLSADVVDAIKRGGPTRGLGNTATAAAPTSVILSDESIAKLAAALQRAAAEGIGGLGSRMAAGVRG